MTFFAASGVGMTAAELLARVAHRIDARQQVRTVTSQRGALVVAANDAVIHHRWVVLGRPSSDPWGRPTHDADLDAVIDSLLRYGGVAIEMFAGPLLALDCERIVGHRGLSGLIGWGPTPDDLRIWTTEGTSCLTVADPISDSSPAFSYDRLEREVAEHTGPLGAPMDLGAIGRPIPVGWDRAVFRTDVEGCAVLHPPRFAEALADPTTARRIRDHFVPAIAAATSRVGAWLHAPFLERPTIDQVGFGG